MRERAREREKERKRERERERERQREREREREIKRERERERERRKRERERKREERETEYYVAFGGRIADEEATIRQKNLPDNFPVCWPPAPTLGFSRESPADMWYYVAYVYNEELVSPIGNQRVRIFPPKSKILFHLLLASKWCRKFQNWSIPVGGVTWLIFKKGNLFPS